MDNPATKDTPISATDLVNLEQLIISYLSKIERHTKQYRQFAEMLENIFQNSEEYKEASKEAKEAAKKKGQVKKDLLMNQEARELNDKVKEYRSEIKQLKDTLSTYLQQYAQNASSLQFEDNEGQVREIVYVAKVVKRSEKFRT